jgi:hypothetical protein
MAPEHKYDNIHLDAEADHDIDQSSNTEVEEESLVGDEKQWHADNYQRYGQRSKRSKCASIFSSLRWMIDTFLLLVILGLLLKDRWQKPSNQGYFADGGKDIGGDITGVGPKCE